MDLPIIPDIKEEVSSMEADIASITCDRKEGVPMPPAVGCATDTRLLGVVTLFETAERTRWQENFQ